MMPVPTPRKREKKEDFIPRCIGTLRRLDPKRPINQIVAICHAQWDRKNLEEVFEVKLGDETTFMLLPETAQGLLEIEDVWLTDEPESIEQPFTAEAVYQHLWFKKGEEYWILRLQGPTLPLMKWICNKDLKTSDQVSCVFEWEKDIKRMSQGKDKVEEIGKAYIEMVDSGPVEVHKSSDMYVKLTMNMKELKGEYEIIRRDERMNLWVWVIKHAI